MKKVIITCLSVLCFTYSAGAYIDQSTAIVSIMNKAAGKAQNIQIPVGSTVEYEKLNITVRTCKQSDPFDAEDYFMFVEVSDNTHGKFFSGWMSHNEPGENPLQNPDYDLWLINCQ